MDVAMLSTSINGVLVVQTLHVLRLRRLARLEAADALIDGGRMMNVRMQIWYGRCGIFRANLKGLTMGRTQVRILQKAPQTPNEASKLVGRCALSNV